MCWLVQGRCGTDSSCSTSAWAAPSVHSERWMQYPRRRPIASSIMGFEDEVEQSFGRPCRQCDGRFKRTYELTSSIVPRGTSFHRGVELDFLLLHWILHSSQATATSLVHRNSVPSTHTRCMITANRRASATIALLHPAMPGDLHRPGLEPGPFRRTHQHALGRFVEHHPHHLISAP